MSIEARIIFFSYFFKNKINMHNINKLSKLLLAITVLFFGLWLGGYVVRQIVVYRLFESDGLALKSFYNNSSLTQVLYIMMPIFIFNIVSYAVFIISLVLLVSFSKLKLKNEGWLFVSLLIIIFCAPFEIYLIIKDYNISKLIFSGNFDPLNVVLLIKDRLSELSSFSLIEIISFSSIIFLAIFQPLRKTK